MQRYEKICIYENIFVLLRRKSPKRRKIMGKTLHKVLLISTGGTITMVRDKSSGALVPADMETFKAYMPERYRGIQSAFRFLGYRARQMGANGANGL